MNGNGVRTVVSNLNSIDVRVGHVIMDKERLCNGVGLSSETLAGLVMRDKLVIPVLG